MQYEDMGQKIEEMNVNIEKVKEEISMKKEPIVPQITAVAVAESNPTGVNKLNTANVLLLFIRSIE